MPFTWSRYDYQFRRYPPSKRDVISLLSLSRFRFPFRAAVTCPNGAPRALVSDRRSVCTFHPRPKKRRTRFTGKNVGHGVFLEFPCHSASLGRSDTRLIRNVSYLSGSNQPIDTKQSALSKARHRLSLRRPFEFIPLTFEAEFFASKARYTVGDGIQGFFFLFVCVCGFR